MDKSPNIVHSLLTAAVLIAVLTALQWAGSWTESFAGPYITDSCLNGVLILSVLLFGLWCGVAAAVISPFCGFMLGLGPELFQAVPAVALGNLMMVIFVFLTFSRESEKVWQKAINIGIIAFIKFLTVFCAVVQVLIPMLQLTLSAEAVQLLTEAYSWPQLITALLGGTAAVLLAPMLQKRFKK